MIDNKGFQSIFFTYNNTTEDNEMLFLVDFLYFINDLETGVDFFEKGEFWHVVCISYEKEKCFYRAREQ